jgi:SAM-dependent methyltransferase
MFEIIYMKRGIQSLEEHFETPSHKSRYYDKLLLRILSMWRKDSVPALLLDIGCGRGEFLAACKKADIRAVGIEADYETAKFASNVGAQVVVADVSMHLPFRGDSFAVIFANQLIEHLNRNKGIELINESWRIMQKPGLIAVFSPSFYNRWNRTKPFHVYCWKPRDLVSVINDAGFQESQFIERIGKHLSILVDYRTRIPIDRYWERRPSFLIRCLDLGSRFISFVLYQLTTKQCLLRVADVYAYKE